MYRELLQLKTLNPDLKVLLVVGARYLVAPFNTVAGSNSTIDTFAINTIRWLRQYGFDGLDVDWEWPDTGTRGLYETFVQDKAVQAWIEGGTARSKLVPGFATFGSPVRLTSADLHTIGDLFDSGQQASAGKYTGNPAFWAYYEICELLAAGWTRARVANSDVPYAFSTSALEWVSYDDPQSFRTKAEYVVSQGLAGAMVWTVAMDDFSSLACNNGTYPLISQIKDVFNSSEEVTTVSLPTAWDTTTEPSVTSHGTTDTPGDEEGKTPRPVTKSGIPLIPLIAGIVGGLVFLAIIAIIIVV
nr:hypothetical protein BaRGS_022306 [Batillaria attramentaria]